MFRAYNVRAAILGYRDKNGSFKSEVTRNSGVLAGKLEIG